MKLTFASETTIMLSIYEALSDLAVEEQNRILRTVQDRLAKDRPYKNRVKFPLDNSVAVAHHDRPSVVEAPK